MEQTTVTEKKPSLTLKQIKQILLNAHLRCDTIGKNKVGNFVARRQFFYTHGYDSKKFADAIAAILSGKIEVVNHGEHWAAFRGGASTAQSSHWWVEFRTL
jgi:hypothetical protein